MSVSGDVASSSTSSVTSSSTSSADRFALLRSLRDLLFGRRRQRRRHDAVVTVSRAKSSRSLDDELESRAASNDVISDANCLVTSSAASSTSVVTRGHKLPYDKLKSISTGDILDSGGSCDWLLDCASSSTDAMQRRALPGSRAATDEYRFTDLTRCPDASDRQAHSVISVTDQDFFDVGWMEKGSTDVADSADGLDESPDGRDDVRDEVASLDVVACRQSLDVTMLKDRLAVRQKNKRQTAAALQRKMNNNTRGEDRDRRKLLDRVPENVDSDVTDSVVTCRVPTSRDRDFTSASAHGRSSSDSAEGTPTTNTTSGRSLPSSQPAAAGTGRARPLITDTMLNDAIRRVRPSPAGESPARGTPVRGRDEGPQVPAAGGLRPKPRPVTMAPASAVSGQTQR